VLWATVNHHSIDTRADKLSLAIPLCSFVMAMFGFIAAVKLSIGFAYVVCKGEEKEKGGGAKGGIK
jgi:hypothetical protein